MLVQPLYQVWAKLKASIKELIVRMFKALSIRI